MKKLVAIVLVVGLLVGVAGIYASDAVVKKAPVKKVVKKVAPKQVAPKPARVVPVAPAPMPAPVAPAPAPSPAPVAVKPAASAGLFGWGLNTDAQIGYLAGQSAITGRADIILDDPMAIGSMLGLKSDSVKWKLGLGALNGNDSSNKSMKAITVAFDGVLMLPADWFGGVSTYVGGGLNYDVYGTGGKSGSLGGQGYVGVMGDIGMGMSPSYAQLGYGIVRSTNASRSAKGLTIEIGQTIKL